MRQTEASGGMTVRLHTGDPSIFGAIREQIDELKKLGIRWEICPGVSSMSAAAAALSAEYTLPEVSQTVIISRIAGRTPVPERESLRNLAQIGATLVLFLSAFYVREVQMELLAGAYTEETPYLSQLMNDYFQAEEEAEVVTVAETETEELLAA